MQGLDIGPDSIKLIQDALADAKTVVWNGPAGVFEFPAFAKGAVMLLPPRLPPRSHIPHPAGRSLASADWKMACAYFTADYQETYHINPLLVGVLLVITSAM